MERIIIITCPTCGAKILIPDIPKLGHDYICGKCKARLVYNEKDLCDKGAPDSSSQDALLARVRRIRKAKRIIVRLLPFLYPFLFAMAPVLFFYSVNVAEMDPSEIIMLLLSTLAITFVLLLIFRHLLKNIMKAALITSIFLILFFYYGPALSASGGWSSSGVPETTTSIILIIICITLFAVGGFLTARTHRDLSGLTIILTIIASLMLLGPTTQLIRKETSIAWENTRASDFVEINRMDASRATHLPDFYYIILDRYASDRTLEEFYGFDNSEFTNYLIEKGFYVASESNANYLNTDSSLASSLNMDYINYLTEELGGEFKDLSPIFSMIQDYAVWRILKSIGYEFIHFGSWWGPTMENPYADMNINYSQMPYASMFLFEKTLAYPVCVALNIIDDRNERHYKCALYTLENLTKIPDIEEPTFVFAHMLLTHPPYVFDADGSYLSTDEINQIDGATSYINQLIYTNHRIQQLIEELLLRSDTPPIIILQADEGPFSAAANFADCDWGEATEAAIKYKMGILNAYYIPDIDYSLLYPSITPVNSFRIVFNSYFRTDFELLPDRSYVWCDGNPYKFVDVTDILMDN